jgi:hypothetical protein
VLPVLPVELPVAPLVPPLVPDVPVLPVEVPALVAPEELPFAVPPVVAAPVVPLVELPVLPVDTPLAAPVRPPLLPVVPPVSTPTGSLSLEVSSDVQASRKMGKSAPNERVSFLEEVMDGTLLKRLETVRFTCKSDLFDRFGPLGSRYLRRTK